MITIAVAVGFLVIFLSMYTTIIERTREIGVLKSLGASKGYIVQIVLSETTLLCLAGVVGGVALSYLMRAIFDPASSEPHHSHHAWLDRARGIDCNSGRTARRLLSRLDGEPQRSGGSAILRVKLAPGWTLVRRINRD